MKKGELKNRLRRRTADKLYDLARSAGHVPAHLPRVADSARDNTRRTGRAHAEPRRGRRLPEGSRQ
jgi:hypothetical protein